MAEQGTDGRHGVATASPVGELVTPRDDVADALTGVAIDDLDAVVSGTVQATHIGRQPVYDVAGALYGYELLFRPSAQAKAADIGGVGSMDGDAATTSTILRAFSEFETGSLLDGRTGLINLTRSFIIGELPLPFTPDQAVLEILETVVLDDEVIAGARALKEAGYRLALDDFVWTDDATRIMPLIDIVKIDISAMPWHEVEGLIERCSPYGVRYLAERIEDLETLTKCREAGFELFQGYYLGRPQTMTVESLSPQQAVTLQLIGKLANPETTAEDVEAVLRKDPGLALRLLKIVNSAGFGLQRRISSIRDAVVLVGMTKLRAWLMLLSVAGSGAPAHRLSDAVALARTCEQLAKMHRASSELAFTAGLLRGIAESLGMTGPELLAGLPSLSDDLAGPIRGDDGPVTPIIEAVYCYLRSDVRGLIATGVPGSDVAQAYLSAMAWAHGVLGLVREA